MTPVERVVPGPSQESVWDYPRPPRVEPVPERIKVVVSSVNVADSTRALRVLETAGPPVYYLPPEDVRMDLLDRTAHSKASRAASAGSRRTRLQASGIGWLASERPPSPGSRIRCRPVARSHSLRRNRV
jgi:Domain of unknown function (DUF427)